MVAVFSYLRHAITTTIMRQFLGYLALSSALLLGVGFSDHRGKNNESNDHSIRQDVLSDKPFVQEYSVKYYLSPAQIPMQLSVIPGTMVTGGVQPLH